MSKRTINLPAMRGKQKDIVTVFDSMAEFADHAQAAPIPAYKKDATSRADWDGGQSFNVATRLCRVGDMARVAPSDRFLSAFEDIAGYERQAFKTINDVAGGAPNVGAYLAGNPVNMRRRARVMSEQAPLNIAVDLVSSGGIGAKDLEKRGAAILALVRLLSAIRPVNLYVVGAGKPSGQSTYASAGYAVRIDTSPLDLARAAHMLCSPAVPRNVMYPLMHIDAGVDHDNGLHWAYGDVDYYRENGARYWQRALGASECLYLAPPYVSDDSITKPEQFIKTMLDKYGQAAD